MLMTYDNFMTIELLCKGLLKKGVMEAVELPYSEEMRSPVISARDRTLNRVFTRSKSQAAMFFIK